MCENPFLYRLAKLTSKKLPDQSSLFMHIRVELDRKHKVMEQKNLGYVKGKCQKRNLKLRFNKKKIDQFFYFDITK